MNDQTRESLSALMDGETSEFELRSLLKALSEDSSLRDRWRRMHQARDALGGGSVPVSPGMDISGAVMSALEAESTPKPAGMPAWMRPAAGFAVAASVAAVVVMGGQQWLAGEAAAPSPQSVATAPVVNTFGTAPMQASFGASGSSGRAAAAEVGLEPAARTAYRELARQRLKQYGLQHAEQAAVNTPQGVISYARVPRFDQ